MPFTICHRLGAICSSERRGCAAAIDTRTRAYGVTAACDACSMLQVLRRLQAGRLGH